MKHKKTLVALILCLVLIFSILALVACDDNDGENNVPLINEKIDNFLDKTIGYMLNNEEDMEIHVRYMSPDTFPQLSIDSYVTLLRLESPTLENSLAVFYFEDNQTAETAFSKKTELFHTDDNIKIEGVLLDNKIIFEGTNGNYDRFNSSHATSKVIPDKLKVFIKEACTQDFPNVDIIMVSISFESQTVMDFNLTKLNGENTLYYVASKSINTVDINLDNCTEDSYINKLDDGIYYSVIKINHIES